MSDSLKQLIAFELTNESRVFHASGSEPKKLWEHADDTLRDWMISGPTVFSPPIGIKLTFKGRGVEIVEAMLKSYFKVKERADGDLVAGEFYRMYAACAGFTKDFGDRKWPEEQKAYCQLVLQTCEIPYFPNRPRSLSKNYR